MLLQTKSPDTIQEKRNKEAEEKRKKKADSSSTIEIGITAPVIDYIPKRNDVDI